MVKRKLTDWNRAVSVAAKKWSRLHKGMKLNMKQVIADAKKHYKKKK